MIGDKMKILLINSVLNSPRQGSPEVGELLKAEGSTGRICTDLAQEYEAQGHEAGKK